MSAAPRKATSPLCPCRGLRRGRGGAPSLRFILSRCLLSLVLCPMEMQKGLTRPFWMRVPIPRAAWGGLQPRSSQRACVTFRVFKGWASRQSVGFDLALPRSSPAMHFLQVQRNQEACSCTAACHDLGWSGRRQESAGEDRALFPIHGPSDSPVVEGGEGGSVLPDLESGLHPPALVCGAVSTFPATFLIPCTWRWHVCSRERLWSWG